jgi:transcriptional regulator with XRE-family HTH domain
MKPPCYGAYTALGAHIKQVLGVTHKRIADALGITPQAVSKKLRSTAGFTASELATLSSVFGKPIGLFFGDTATDGAVLSAIHDMFQYAPMALDAIIALYRTDRKLLHVLGRVAQQMRRESLAKGTT